MFPLQEPFSAWADLSAGKSRIDYYGGMVKTFQRGDVKPFGTMVKIIPMTNEVNTLQLRDGVFRASGRVENERLRIITVIQSFDSNELTTREEKYV